MQNNHHKRYKIINHSPYLLSLILPIIIFSQFPFILASNGQVYLDVQINIKSMNNKRLSADSVFLGKYISKRKLGKGAFGDVFLVQEEAGGPKWALKVIDKKKMVGDNEQLADYLQGEIACMKDMEYDYIVELREFIEDDEYFYMVLEYCDGGDLMNLQAIQPNKVFTLQLATEYLSQVILGLEALHKRGYLHRDIKPQNVLVKNVNGRKVFKIADFGFTKKASNVEGTVLGTEQYMAPEIYRQGVEGDVTEGDMYGYEVDMWAFGVLLFYMLNLSYPFEINPYWTLQDKYKELRKQAESFSYKKAVANTRRKNMDNCTDEVEDLFRKIFRIDQEKRITFSEIRQHPVFAPFFPKPSPESKILYNTKFKSSFLSKGKIKNRLQEKANQLRGERLGIPSIICVEQVEKTFAKEKQLISLELEEINFLPEIVNEIQLVEKEVGLMQSLMFAYNLIKYHIVLFKNFVGGLTAAQYQKKYPGLDWQAYFRTPEFAQNKREYAKAIYRSQVRYAELYKKCKGQYREISKLNEFFGAAFDEQITEVDLCGDFFRSYRKSTDIIYSTLKDYLRTNKILKFYYYLCMTCIVHVFSDLVESEELKRNTFSAFIQELTDNSMKEERISYQKLAHYLRNSQKQVILKLAKKIIEEVMTMK